MARSRTRRRAGRRRNAKGHFVKARRSSRRRHRNPSGHIKVGRRWRKITKYARRRRRGSRRGQIRAFHFPKRYRRSRRRRVHTNPVVVSNPRRRSRRARRNPYRSHRRRYARRNPAASFRLSSDPIAAIKNALMSAFSMDTMETLVQMGVGFGGALTLGKFLYLQPWMPVTLGASITKVGSTFLSAALLTGASALMKNSRMTARILTGGLFATLWQGLSEAVSGTSVQQYMPTLSGSPETDAFRRAIESEVLKELKGGGVHGYLRAAGSEGISTYLQPAGINYLRAAGSEAYLTQVNTERANAGMSAYLTQVNEEMANAGVGDDDEFSRRGMPEKF